MMMIVRPVVLAGSPTALPENIEPRESSEDTLSKILEIKLKTFYTNGTFRTRIKGNWFMLPVKKVRTDSVSPVHWAPDGVVGVVLIMIFIFISILIFLLIMIFAFILV